MKTLKIVVPTDFSEASKCALANAIHLTRKLKGEIHLLHVVEIPTASVANLPVDLIDIVESRGMKELSDLVGFFDGDLPPITKIVRTGIPSKTPAEVILEYAKDLRADYIVLGTHGRRGARRVLLGSVAEEVVRHAVCPVLTVRKQKKAYLVPAYKKVLVPIDFSESSKIIMEKAEELAVKLGASLTLMHIVDIEFYPFYGLASDPVKLIERNMIDASMNKLNDLIQPLRKKGIHINWETDTGHPARNITEYSDRNEIDLILMGSHGRSGFDRMMIGSTSEKVLRSAHCPVMIVNTAKVELTRTEEAISVSRVATPA